MPKELMTRLCAPSETVFLTSGAVSSMVLTAIVEEPPPSKCSASYAPYSRIKAAISACVTPMLSPLPSTTIKIAFVPSCDTPKAVLGCLPAATISVAGASCPCVSNKPPPPNAVSIWSKSIVEVTHIPTGFPT